MSRPVAVLDRRPEVALSCGCVLGEGVIWDHRLATLYWVDINGQSLWSWRPDGGEEAKARALDERGLCSPPPEVPATVLHGPSSGLAGLALEGGEPAILVRPEPDLPGNRLNDGVAAPDGSVFFGTLNEADRQPSGHFYHWSGAGLARFGICTVTTNGPAIDPDLGLLYATDTSRGRVWRYRLREDGALGEPEEFAAFGEGEGHPDGMAVDAESHVWICHFRGSRITRFDPDGEPVLVVPMPTPQVTKLAFGGPDLRTIYVTTAARDLDRAADPLAGHLFRLEAGIAGRPAGICRYITD